MQIVYLHGFASSPQSSKAQFFRHKFEALGIPISIPELDQRDFEHLTVSGMLDVVGSTVAGRSTVLVGSSLGGFVAGLFAAPFIEHEAVRFGPPGRRAASRGVFAGDRLPVDQVLLRDPEEIVDEPV